VVNTHIPEACVLLHSNIQSASRDVDALVDPETQLQSVVKKTKGKVRTQKHLLQKGLFLIINQENHKQ